MALTLVLVLIVTLGPTAVTSGAPLAQGPVSAVASLTQTSLRVGDPVGLRITVNHHHQTQIEFPALYDKLGSLEVVRINPLAPTRQLDGSQVSVMEYTITGFVPGTYAVPPVAISYTEPDGQQGRVETGQDLTLEIISVLTDPAAASLKDVKPPMVIPRGPLSYARTGVLVALGVSFLGLSVIAARRWTRVLRRPFFLIAGIGDPEEEARQELDRIAKRDLVTQRDYTGYYGGISTCIRGYLDNRFDLDAMASTTREVRSTMGARGLDPWQARVIAGLLEECDVAKWAHYQPGPVRADRAITIAYEISSLPAARKEWRR